MSYTAVAVVAVALVLVVIGALIDLQLRKGAGGEGSGPTVFRVSPWVFTATVIAAFMGSVFVFWGFDSTRPATANLMFKAVGALFALGSAVAIWWYAKCRVVITESEVTVINPAGKRTIRFENVKELQFSNGMIVLDEGKIPRMVIPAIYRGSDALLAALQFRLRGLAGRARAERERIGSGPGVWGS
jgi:hypothetical protein